MVDDTVDAQARRLARRHSDDIERISSGSPGRNRVWAVLGASRPEVLARKAAQGAGPGVMEIVSDDRGDTYRGVYTVRFADSVYVLHVFQKKSKKGTETPQSEIELVRQRLKRAAELHEEREK